MWAKERPTEIGYYWRYINKRKYIVKIWRYKDSKTLLTDEFIDGLNLELNDSYYDVGNDAFWSDKIKEPNDPNWMNCEERL